VKGAAEDAVAGRDVEAEEHQQWEVAEEEVSWPPEEADHGEVPTWAGLAGCGSDSCVARTSELTLC